jgi:hypothetical protein
MWENVFKFISGEVTANELTTTELEMALEFLLEYEEQA